jgi:hypothetical protein
MHPLKPLTDDLKHSISIAFIIDISIDIIIGALIASLMIELILAKFCPTTIIPPSSQRRLGPLEDSSLRWNHACLWSESGPEACRKRVRTAFFWVVLAIKCLFFAQSGLYKAQMAG